MAILNHGSTIRTADGGQTTTTIVTASNIGSYAVASNATYFIGTTQNVFNRASGAQTLTGVSIDGNAANITAYTINQNLGTSNAPSFAGMTSTGMLTSYTNLSNNYDWQNSPISIRERGLVSNGQSSDIYSPSLNFHWAMRWSSSLWMNQNGNLNWGGYSETGVPSNNGVFRTGEIYVNTIYDKNDSTYYLDPANSGTSLLVAGKVGIGATSPGYTLTVNGTIAYTPSVGNPVLIGNDATYGTSGTGRYVTLGFGGLANSANKIFAHNMGEDGLYICSATSRSIYFRAGGGATDHVAITSGGNLGIATVSADTNLQVVGHVHVGNQTTFENAGGWNKTIYLDGAIHARLRILGSAYASGKNSATETSIWVDNSAAPYSGLDTNAGSFRINAGFTTMLNSARSPLFYDSDNTAFYIDPASESNLRALNIDGGTINDTNDATLYITAQNDNDWGIYVNKNLGGSTNFGIQINVASADNYGLYLLGGGSERFRVRGNGTVSATGDFRAPIFYDSDNTSYYVNAASTSSLNALNLADSVDVGTSIYIRNNLRMLNSAGNGWLETIVRNSGSPYFTNPIDGGTFLASDGAENNNWLFQENARGWGLFYFNRGTQSGQTFGSYTTVGAETFIVGQNSGTTMPSTWTGYNASSKVAIMLSNYTGYIWANDTIFSATGLRAPIFYDSNDTTYYIDPASTSRIVALWVRGSSETVGNIYVGGGSAGDRLNINYDQIWTPNGNLHLQYSGGGNIDMNFGGGHAFSRTSLRAPIFYDFNNTAFYTDPASTSVLNRLTIDGGNYAFDYFQSLSDFTSGTLVTTDIPATAAEGESFVMNVVGKSYSGNTSPFNFSVQGYLYNSTIINYSGLSLDSTSLNTVKIFENGGVLCFWWPTITYWNAFEVSVRAYNSAKNNYNRVTNITNSIEPTGTKKVTVTLQRFMRADVSATNSVDLRAPIFYDSNDTTYYTDPSSLSNIVELKTNKNWYDSSASAWGGGINMGGNNPSIGFQSTASTWWYMFHHSSDSINFYRRSTSGGWNQDCIWDSSGNFIWRNSSVRAPIFYDFNNTAYYVDPASASSLNTLTMAGIITTVSSGTAINFSGQSDSFGYNATSGQGTYIKGTGGTYIYGGGVFYDGSAIRTLLHSNNYSGYSAFSGSVSSGGNITATGYIYTSTYFQTGGNLIYPSGYGATQTLQVSNSANNAWIAGISIAPGGLVTMYGDARAPIFYDSDNTSYYINAAGASSLNTLTMAGTITGALDATASFTGGVCTAASYNYILNGANDTGNKLVIFVNGSTRTADGGVNALTIRNDGGTFILGQASYLTSILGSSVTINSNVALHAGNYTSYTLPRGGSWYGVNLPGSRWGGFSTNGGEIVFGQDLPAVGQMGILIDGCYIAGENNGFWSLASSNDWTTRRGMSYDGTYLNFTTNSAIGLFSDLRSPIFYDSNDTTYYTDPASFSLISSMGIGGLTSSSNTGMYDSYVDGSSSYFQSPPLIIRKDSSATGAIDQAPVGLFIYNLNGTNNTWTKLSMGSREAAGAGNTVSIAGLAAQKTAGTANSWATGDLHFWTKAGGTQITNMVAYSSGYVQSGYSFRAPIFYDSNNTGYYLDPASSSQLSAVYANDWFRAQGNTGLYFQDKGYGITSAGAAGNSYGNASTYGTGLNSWQGWGIGSRHCIMSNGGDNFGVHDNTRSWLYYWDGTYHRFQYGYLESANSLRAPLFYDSDNTAYYANPAGTSVFNELVFGSNITIRKNNDRNLEVQGGGGSDSGIVGKGSSGQFAFQVYGSGSGSYGFLDGVWAGWDIRKVVDGDLFLNDNNSYYLNPASTSLFNATRHNSVVAGSNSAMTSAGQVAIYSSASPYISFHDGGVGRTAYMQENGGRFYFGEVTYTESEGSFRAPLFYDVNDTGYYVDPNSASNLVSITNRENLPGGAGTGYYWSGTAMSYYWTKIANVGGGDAHAALLITYKTDVNYNPFGLALLSISRFNSSTFSVKLEKLNGDGRQILVRVDNNNDVWLYTEVEWSSYKTWKTISKLGSPTIYYSSVTEQLTTPANSIEIATGQEVRGTQGAATSATVSTVPNNFFGGLTVRSDVRAPIFYDSNNTSYYCDPSSTSNLVGLTVANTISGSINGSATSLNSSNSIARVGSSGNYNTDFQNTPAGTVRHLGDDSTITNNPGGAWWFLDNYRHSNGSNYWGTQVAWGWEDNANRLATRNVTGGSFGSWVYYLNSSNYNSYAIARGGDTVDGIIYFRSNKGSTSTVGANNTYSLEAFSSDAGAAGMSFHRGGYYAVNMGLDPDNIMRIGGWSASANRWELDMSGNNWVASSFRAPIFYDSNNTSYYVDPASTSSLNILTLAGDATWSGYNSGNARAVRIGYSGGNYGGISYGINYTASSGSHTYAINDAATRIDLADGIQVYSAAAGVVGTSVSWTTLLVGNRGNTYLQWKGNNVIDTSYSGTVSGLSIGGSSASCTGNAANVTGTVAIANGGTGATSAANARTNLGATTAGSNLFTLTNPSAITFLRVNADNTVSALNASDFRTAIGANSGETSTNQSLSGTTGCTIDVAAATVHILTLSNATTISSITYNNRSNNPAVNTLLIVLKFLGTASVTWSNVVWSNGTAPTLTGTNGKADVYALTSYKGGTTGPAWIGSVVGQNIDSTNL